MAKSLKMVDFPSGTYDGRWSAYFVKAIFPEAYVMRFGQKESNEFEVDEGVRGINCKCEIIVKEDGYAYVK